MMPPAHFKTLIEALVAKIGTADEALIAAVDLAVLVALADGTIDADEKSALTATLEALMRGRMAPHVVRHLIRESKNQIENAGAEARARAVGRELANHGAADDGLRLGLAIAFASDGLSETERACLAQVAKAAGMSDARFAALAAAAANPPAPVEEEAVHDGGT